MRWRRKLDDFAHAESRDGGKPIRLAREAEIPRAISNLRFFAHAATQFASESHHGQAGLNYTLRQPLGVVATISPWNLPLYLFTWKIAPALAAGNTVVAKPSEVTPLTATMLGELAAQIGFPKGVLNIVHGLGPEVGEPLVAHPRVKAVSFTGSTAVGRRIAGLAASAAEEGVAGAGRQEPDPGVRRQRLARPPRHAACARPSRTPGRSACAVRASWSSARIYSEFRDTLVERARGLRVGDPIDEDNQLGPLVSQAHFDKVDGGARSAPATKAARCCAAATRWSGRAGSSRRP